MKPAAIIAAIGATGSGKSAWVKQAYLTPKPSRLVVFDFKAEHQGNVVSNLQSFFKEIAKNKFNVVYRPSFDDRIRTIEFDAVCKGVFEAGNLTFLVEELAQVTRPMYAPAAWRRLCLVGRDYKTSGGVKSSLVVIGTAQRPQLIDKNFLDNCTLIHCGRLNRGAAVKYMAELLGVETTVISGLQDLEYVELDALKQKNSSGKLSFAPKKTRSKGAL